MSLVVTSVADSTEPADPMQQSFYTFIVSQASSWLIQKFIVLLGLSHPSLLSSQQMALPVGKWYGICSIFVIPSPETSLYLPTSSTPFLLL